VPDDGSADATVRAMLADPGCSSTFIARSLRSARLLATVVAVLDQSDENGGDKDSHMAVVSMVNERGERGLLVFTGTDSLAAWNADARPVPALGREIARSALAEGAAAVIIDVVGPTRIALTGKDLAVLADTLDLDVVTPPIRTALAPLTFTLSLLDVRATAPDFDLLVEVSADLIASTVATLSADSAIQRLVPGGIGVRECL